MDIEPRSICGVYGQKITVDYAERLGRAIGTRIAGGRLIIGGDTRSSTPALKQALITGILATGCEVYDVGILPTPALNFAQDRFWADGSVMVTASHRPVEENGFKIMLGKFPPSAVDIQQLCEVIEQNGPFASGPGRLISRNTLEPYAQFLVARFVPAQPLRIVIDTGNGTMRQLAVPILLSLGYEVTEYVYESVEDLRPDPALPENKALLRQAVLENDAHLGVAFDADGDSVVFVEETGRVLSPEWVLILLVRALLAYQPGSQVLYHAGYAAFVVDAIRQYGGIPTVLDVDQVEFKRAFLERGAILGGDLWGHYYFRSMGGDDALYATLVLLRFISRLDGSLKSLLDRLPAS